MRANSKAPPDVFRDEFRSGCRGLESDIARRFCGSEDDADTVLGSTTARLRAVLRWLQPAPSTGLAELLLDNSVHQVSLCIACDAERLQFVEAFRTRFRKQYVIASKVQAFWLTRMCPDKTLMREFACTGHVPAEGIRWHHQAEVYELCRKIVPQHVPGIDESEGEHLSTVQELEACADLVRGKCEDLLARVDRRHPPQAQCAQACPQLDRAAGARLQHKKPPSLLQPSAAAAACRAELDFADERFDF